MGFLDEVLATIEPSQRATFALLLTITPEEWIASLDEISGFEAKARTLGVVMTPKDWALQDKIARAISEPYNWTPALSTAELYVDALRVKS
jgi:hypothetical protein